MPCIVRCRPRRAVLLAALLLLLSLALRPTHPLAVDASTPPTQTCVPATLAIGANTICTITLTSPLALNGTLQVIPTIGGSVTGCNAAASFICVPRFSAASQIVQCISPLGPQTNCPANTAFTLSLTSGLPGPLGDAIVIIQGGPYEQFNYDAIATFAGKVSISPPTVACLPSTPAVGTSTTCTVTLTSPLFDLAQIGNTVSQPGGAIVTCLSESESGLLCPPLPPPGSNPGAGVSVECNQPFVSVTCPPGSSYTLAISALQAGPLSLSLRITEGQVSQSFNYTGDATFTGRIKLAPPVVTCDPATVPVGESTTCTIRLMSPLLSGATLDDTLPQPEGATFVACTASPWLSCTFSGPPPLPAVTQPNARAHAVCISAGGCPVGSSFTLTITATGSGPLTQQFSVTEGPISQSFNYTGEATFHLPVDKPLPPTTVCTPAAPVDGASTVCTITLASPLASGGWLIDTVEQPAGVAITSCTASGELVCPPPPPPPPQTAVSSPASQGTPSITVFCFALASCPAGSAFTLTITAPASGVLSGLVTISGGGRMKTFSFQGSATFVPAVGSGAGGF